MVFEIALKTQDNVPAFNMTAGYLWRGDVDTQTHSSKNFDGFIDLRQPSGSSKLLNLPLEVLSLIIDKLDLNALKSLGLTKKFFHELSKIRIQEAFEIQVTSSFAVLQAVKAYPHMVSLKVISMIPLDLWCLYSIASLKHLESLVISCLGLKDDVRCLTNNRKLIHLDVSDSQLSTAGINWLVSELNLQKLNLSGCKISLDSIRELSKKEYLKHLILNECILCDADIEVLALGAQFESLSLAFNEIGCIGAKWLAGVNSLEKLILYSNFVGDEGVCFLAKSESLKYLDLTGNLLTRLCVADLAKNKNLQYLNLSHNDGIGAGDLTPFEDNTNIKTLILENLSLSEKDVHAVSKMKALESLSFRSYTMSVNDYLAISKSTSLKKLAIKRVNISLEGLKKLSQNRSLLHLDFSESNVSIEGVKVLSLSPSLKSVNFCAACSQVQFNAFQTILAKKGITAINNNIVIGRVIPI